MFDLIVQKLQEIEKSNNIQLLYVAESGSRAWGFASMDSDYDVRGIFIYPCSDYLSIDEPKESFEWIENDWFDVGVWELRKTLRLLRKSNSVLLEWLQSPIVYKESSLIRKELLTLAEQYYQPRASLHHYRGIAKTASNGMSENTIRLKKWSYVLRALLAAYWTVTEKTIPPMQLTQLFVTLPETYQQEINELVQFKADKDEHFLWTPTSSMQKLIEFLWEKTNVVLNARETPDSQLLNEWFRKILDNAND